MAWLLQLDNLKALVPLLAIAMSVVTFIIYVFRSISDKSIADQIHKVVPEPPDGQKFAPDNLGDVVTVAKAMGELGSVLAKMSPSVVALVASVLFLAVAALSTGALQGGHKEDALKAQNAPSAGAEPPKAH